MHPTKLLLTAPAVRLLLCALLLLVGQWSLAQTIIIQGRVTDAEQSTPLEGVTVQLKGAALNTITNAEGKYELKLTATQAGGNSQLMFSYTGYKALTMRINNRTTIDAALLPGNSELQAVVVSGYSRPKRKEEVVGAISTVTSKELLADRAIESFDKMLDGLAAGVQVETNTELGTPVRINIRGQNSLTNLTGTTVRTGAFTSTQPLFVIDGVPITEQRPGDEPMQFGDEQYRNPLAGINPDDIESISILKDAAAASVYGANASNGVIIITTKSGKSGKPRISLGISGGISNPINRIKWLSGPQYHGLLKELFISEGDNPVAAELKAGSAEIDTDWFGITNRTGVVQNIDMEISGGSEQSTYRMSASYLNQQSIQRGNELQQYYLRLRLDNKLGKKLNMTTSIAPTINRKNALTVYSELTPIIPNVPTFNADGTYYNIPGVPNPVAVLDQNINQSEGGSMNANIRLDYQLLPTLKLSGNLGTDILINKQNNYLSPLNATGSNFGGRATIYDRTSFSWIGFTQASWSPKLKDGQKLDVLGGFEARSELVKLLRGSGTGFTYYRLNELSNARQQSSASSRQQTNTYSIYGQGSYGLKDRYYVTGSLRQDASSIFGTHVSTTINGVLGLGWNAKKEVFLANNKVISALRFRVSYGTTGNSRIGSYEARGLYAIGNSGYNGQSSSSPVSLPNPNLSWEKGYKTNAGFDLGLWNRLKIEFDFYNNIVDDAISTVEIPYETGFGFVLANTSKMRNRGWDVSIRGEILKGKIHWNATLNMGFNKNEVLEVR
ncbi:MAG TPA: SusC/RagA family TonB-linked outer membrane protein, partial [Phnomibacter sp.]|nr:SusC/RagA family TonB-linked outer membrane protein [Phnomibacter sp.]